MISAGKVLWWDHRCVIYTEGIDRRCWKWSAANVFSN